MKKRRGLGFARAQHQASPVLAQAKGLGYTRGRYLNTTTDKGQTIQELLTS